MENKLRKKNSTDLIYMNEREEERGKKEGIRIKQEQGHIKNNINNIM